jgi:hypothetical protein
MSNKGKKLDGQASFDWEKRIDEYVERKAEIFDACYEKPKASGLSIKEADEAIAVSIKRSLRRSGFSREQLLDRINEFYGLTDDGDGGRKPLSLNMLNNYLGKYGEYHIPAYLLIPIIMTLETFDPVQAIVEPSGARVISESEVKMMNLGKLENTISEMQRLKRELKRS